MKLKKIAIRGIIGLAVVIALCFFFSETIKSITTPKVQLISPTTGRFEDKIALTGTVFFEKEKEFVIEEARKAEGIVIDKVYVSPGFTIEKDELIFTAHMPTYDTAIKKLEDDYTAKARELLDLEIANRSSSLTSQQNELHQAVIEKQTLSSQAEFDARALALEEKITLPRTISDWKTVVVTAGGSDALKEAADRAAAAKMVYEETYKAFMDSYNNKKINKSILTN